jgi:phosphopantothenoylcysteine synthetase/decarboxylase
MSNAPATAIVAEAAGSSPGTNRRPRPNIILAITGSVAAIKGPELAVKLVNFGANVRVLLTKGGHNFWTKAEAYNQVQWEKMHEMMQGGKDGDRGKISVYRKYKQFVLVVSSC